MGIASIVVASVVLTTAEFCANPIEGGVGEPQFCRLNAPQQIETPVFSIVIDSTFLIGIDRNGRRLLIQPSLRQSQVSVNIEAIPLGEGAESHAPVIDRYSEGKLDCSPKTLGGTIWDWCRGHAEEHDSAQFYFLRTSQYIVLISHYSSKLGEDLTPAVHRLLETVVVHGI
jgi:hypothetical protein